MLTEETNYFWELRRHGSCGTDASSFKALLQKKRQLQSRLKRGVKVSWVQVEKRSWCSKHRRLPATEESSCGLRLCRRAYSHASHHKAQCFPWCRAFVFSIFMFTQWQNIPLLGVKHWCSRHENRSSAKSKWSATLQHCPSLRDVTLC